MPQAILHTIRRRAPWAPNKFMVGPTACITERTDTHVTGYFQEREDIGAASIFTVKHDGKCFSQGSGSSKMRFYFSDSGKHIKE